MKIFRRTLAVLIASVMLVSSLASCTTLEKLEDGTYDRGAVINIYLSDEVYNFDPQIPVTDDAMLKVYSLIYEGLTVLDDNGKWKYGMMDSYEVRENDLDGYSIVIELKDTKWTDGRTVQATDFVYSWKRLLDPSFKGEAACLLYDIKNARAINSGDASVDDLGVSAVDTYTLKITFENSSVDIDRFFTNLSAIALVPIREDVISRYAEYAGTKTKEEDDLVNHWAQRSTSIVTNGPFTVKQMIEDETPVIRLERNGYYFRDIDAGDLLDETVIPYRLITNYEIGNLEAQLEAFENEDEYADNKIFYIGELPLSMRADYEDDAEVEDTLITQSFMFNTTNKLFQKAEVRRALSEALDREYIAEMLVFADAATGLVPTKAFDTGRKTSFREEGGDLISTTADLDDAKSLLSSAGVKSGSFSIMVRDEEADIAVAEYAAEVWGSLGFTVTVDVAEVKSTGTIDEEEGKFKYAYDTFEENYKSGEFDVVLLDVSMPSPDAFSVLAPFAADYSGYGTDLYSGDYEVYGHVTGYSSDEYNAAIEAAYTESDEDTRAENLHKAEEILMNDMPVCPLVYLKNAYLSDGLLSGFDTNYYGMTVFTSVKMKNYIDYKEADIEEEETEEDTATEEDEAAEE